MNEIAFQFLRDQRQKAGTSHVPLGQMLLEHGEISVGQLLRGLSLHKKLQVPLGQVLVSEGSITEARLFDMLSIQWNLARADFAAPFPDEACTSIGASFCLKYEVFPASLENGVLYLAVSSRENFAAAEDALQNLFGLVVAVIASRSEILGAINHQFPQELAMDAAFKVPSAQSCRPLAEATFGRYASLVVLTVMVLTSTILVPAETVIVLTWIAISVTIASAVLKGLALLSSAKGVRAEKAPQATDRRPPVSVLVPLHREPDVLPSLVKRLSRISYPKALLEVLLVVEENDHETIQALSQTALPCWITVLKVPEGQPKTKPRALNHAMRFCRGEIIGIYDAEDAPAADQIDRAVEAFHTAGPDVGCVQGILQFYNARQNWLARCFTMDYAAWFRVILPGLSRLGLPVPLGGTTLFIKRHVIESLSGWDAHNVTEDADLGLRLYRNGYRTILIESVTEEEANCRLWPWIRQRSRWIKGYMVTYWAHTRQPLTLIRDIGLRNFVGIQVLFLGTILHFIIAPLLWSFWISTFGAAHPFFQHISEFQMTALTVCFLGSETIGLVIIALALKRADRWFLLPWIPTMTVYFLLAVPAGIKAAYEFITAPIFWDKTEHGLSEETDA